MELYSEKSFKNHQCLSPISRSYDGINLGCSQIEPQDFFNSPRNFNVQPKLRTTAFQFTRCCLALCPFNPHWISTSLIRVCGIILVLYKRKLGVKGIWFNKVLLTLSWNLPLYHSFSVFYLISKVLYVKLSPPLQDSPSNIWKQIFHIDLNVISLYRSSALFSLTEVTRYFTLLMLALRVLHFVIVPLCGFRYKYKTPAWADQARGLQDTYCLCVIWYGASWAPRATSA